MKEENGSEKKKRMTKEKKFYLFTAVGCAAVLLAIIIVALVLTNTTNVGAPTAVKHTSSSTAPSDDDSDENVNGGEGNNEPVINTPENMTMPLSAVSVVNDYGFYHNKTLNHYYEHRGVDFVAEAGTEVLAVNNGVIESIYKDDLLTGTEITIDHGDGVKSVYRFVTAADGLTVGMEVKQGDVIATVAQAAGEEYKEGAHLHFEIRENGKCVDPSTHLTFEEK